MIKLRFGIAAALSTNRCTRFVWLKNGDEKYTENTKTSENETISYDRVKKRRGSNPALEQQDRDGMTIPGYKEE